MVAKLGYGIMCFCDYDFLDVDCNIVEVMILSFKSCESLLFSNFFQRGCPYVLLKDKQKGKSGELIDHGFYLLSAMVYNCCNN